MSESRWQCRGCGRFLRHDDVHFEDAVDPAYHVVTTRVWGNCPKCGDVNEPRLHLGWEPGRP